MNASYDQRVLAGEFTGFAALIEANRLATVLWHIDGDARKLELSAQQAGSRRGQLTVKFPRADGRALSSDIDCWRSISVRPKCARSS